MIKVKAAPVGTHTFMLGGGDNPSTSALQMADGDLYFSQNYETVEGAGYRRIDGYERFNGMIKPSAAEWRVLSFTAGVTAFVVGEVVTGSVSTATGEVLSVTLTSGAWDGSGVGEIVVWVKTGTFGAGDALTSTSGAAACSAVSAYADTDAAASANAILAEEAARAKILTVPGSGSILGVWVYKGVTYAFRNNAGGTAAAMYKSSASGWTVVTTPTLAVGGRYEFANYIFTSSQLMVGCDGVNKAFVFDGTTFTQLTTGATVDKPTHIAPHRQHLFLSFATGSIIHSAIGDPTSYAAIDGAGEIEIGDVVSGMVSATGGTLAVICRNSAHVISGSSALDWQLQQHSRESGAIEWTVQDLIGGVYYFDDRGVTSLQAVDYFGDFSSNALSKKIDTRLNQKKDLVSTSLRVREKDQYRLFFTDGSAIYGRLRGREQMEFTGAKFPITVRCACSAEDNSGNEVLFFGSDDGYVYQLDSGTSFDGAEVVAYMRTSYAHMKSHRNNKRFLKAIIEVDAPTGAGLQFTPDYDYGSPIYPSADTSALTNDTGGGFWDLDNWDEFLWDQQVVGEAEAYLFGTGRNIALVIRSSATYELPHTIRSVTYHYNLHALRH